jgi:hypothetical protein
LFRRQKYTEEDLFILSSLHVKALKPNKRASLTWAGAAKYAAQISKRLYAAHFKPVLQFFRAFLSATMRPALRFIPSGTIR